MKNRFRRLAMASALTVAAVGVTQGAATGVAEAAYCPGWVWDGAHNFSLRCIHVDLGCTQHRARITVKNYGGGTSYLYGSWRRSGEWSYVSSSREAINPTAQFRYIC